MFASWVSARLVVTISGSANLNHVILSISPVHALLQSKRRPWTVSILANSILLVGEKFGAKMLKFVPKSCCFVKFSFKNQFFLIDHSTEINFVLGTTAIDRYTNLDHLMKWCGYAFSKNYLNKLVAEKNPPTTFPRGSYELMLEDDQQHCDFDAFISYRGATSSIWLMNVKLK